MGLFVAQQTVDVVNQQVLRVVPVGRPNDSVDFLLGLLTQFYADNENASCDEEPRQTMQVRGDSLYIAYVLNAGGPTYVPYIYAAEISLSESQLVYEAAWPYPGLSDYAEACVNSDKNISVTWLDGNGYWFVACGPMTGEIGVAAQSPNNQHYQQPIMHRGGEVAMAVYVGTGEGRVSLATPNFAAGTVTFTDWPIPNTVEGGFYNAIMPTNLDSDPRWVLDQLVSKSYATVLLYEKKAGWLGHRPTKMRVVGTNGTLVHEFSAKSPTSSISTDSDSPSRSYDGGDSFMLYTRIGYFPEIIFDDALIVHDALADTCTVVSGAGLAEYPTDAGGGELIPAMHSSSAFRPYVIAFRE